VIIIIVYYGVCVELQNGTLMHKWIASIVLHLAFTLVSLRRGS